LLGTNSLAAVLENGPADDVGSAAEPINAAQSPKGDSMRRRIEVRRIHQLPFQHAFCQIHLPKARREKGWMRRRIAAATLR
jgi:hypothetical protein